ncbi:unnamed protein product [marine sediment metagenome]|uniref:DUF6429 domain-containing protein n=1 Tax=marine sediment metagenome TaxID=412755 RepID=X1H2Y3_9ZZZZ
MLGLYLQGETMKFDKAKVDEMVLALRYINAFEYGLAIRAWKGFNWDALNRLHE